MVPKVKWTKEQLDAISKKSSNILVAAAAGSGKTAVLVERIIRKIIEDRIDIDKILVVTFTSPAASEMRERILEAIYKKIDENPEDENLQRQVNLLNKASICTIDSFCLDVIRNNFFEIDVSANARVADGTEVNLLKQETLDDIFEEKYIENNKDFLDLIGTYTKYNKDEDLENLILNIYEYIQSTPFPEEWLEEKIEMFNISDKLSNFSNTEWGKRILEYADKVLEDCILKLESVLKSTQRFKELEKYNAVIQDDIVNYNQIKQSLDNWDLAVEEINNFTNKPWPSLKKIENCLKDEAKEIRDSAKKEFTKIKDLIPYSSEEANSDILYMYGVLKKLQSIILEFSERFYNKKREKNIIDFNDMEHLALKILLKKDENGNIVPTEVAKKYSEKFEEIAIDEYQDSNLVQECILNSVSRGNNIFMVGDVKQSIYKFRQARPELFLEKYNSYKLNPDNMESRKIQLFKNFRSRENILEVTNIVFKNIMSTELGNINYDENEYLNLGASYEKIENQNLKTDINIIEKQDDENDIWKEEQDSEEEQEELVQDVILEARFVARKVKELIDSKYQVTDKKEGKRDIKFRDIAILLRSANTVATIYEKELSELGIAVYSDSSESYLQSIEIDTIMSLLKVINNPMQDIPLVTVLRSSIGNFTDNELIDISFFGQKESFYEKILKAKENSNNNELKEKIELFLNLLDKWREEEKYKPLDELIWQIYLDSGYLDYVSLMPNGELRVSNLKMLFERAKQYERASFKGLYNFINFIDKLKGSSGDLSAAKIIGENENVVRIMSIHKSKGLEFPVVILAGTGKQFNFQDLNKKLLLHQDLGIGPQYIDATRHIEFKTLAKKAIALTAKRDIVSEEMRVLYVALTRAKEKLIITGMQGHVNKCLSEKQKLLEAYKDGGEKLNPFLVQKYKTYIDWLELVYLKEGIENTKDLMEVNIIPKADLLKNIKDEENEEKNINEKIKDEVEKAKDSDRQEKIKKILEWTYNYNNLETVPTKTSVTKIKELNKKNSTLLENSVKDTINTKPKFLNLEEDSKISAAEKGTLMHLCIQKMDEKKDYTKEDIKQLIENLVLKDLITKVEAENINIEKLLEYTKSDLWQELRYAKKIFKEQPFYINIPVNKIYNLETSTDENVLVQGIIDLYFINKYDELVLVDYKTDYVKIGEEALLMEKYETQIELYKQALEESTGKKVKRAEIYSIYLNKLIEK